MRFWTPIPLVLATIVIACSSSDSGDADGQGAAATATGLCQVTNQLTGQIMSADELAKHDDPVAKLILSTEGCPKTVSALTKKFREKDTNNCPDLGPDAVASGVKTALIGEAAQESGQPGSYRNVIARDCDGRPPFGLLLSGSASGAGVDDGFVELITQDKTKGVFDYYSQEGGRWTFFGTSADFISGDYTCKTGQCTPKIASQTRCAGCHPGGGLNMKELRSPWVFWDVGGTSVPGVAETITKSPAILGARGGGVDLQEARVDPGNQAWVKKRLEILRPLGTQAVLRALFCTIDMNVQTSNSPKEGLTSLSSDFFVDRSFRGPFSIPIDNADYKALLDSTKSTLPGGGKDTPLSFIYPQRSAQDLFYQGELVAGTKPVVDDDFVKDVLHVDFTRPAYSTARCDLLKFAPKLVGDALTPVAIRDGFKTALAGQTSPAAVQLLANLNAVRDQAAHQTDVDNFFKACTARPKKELLTDVMKWASHLRQTVRATSPIIESDVMLPKDNQADTAGAFDPKTCVLSK